MTITNFSTKFNKLYNGWNAWNNDVSETASH